jgi:putative redox protein
MPDMADAAAKPPTKLELVWEHDLVFGGRSGDIQLSLDSASVAGPSPMQALAFALAGCMAMDVVYVLEKGRLDLRGLRTDFTGERSADDPHRFTAITLHFTIAGKVPDEKVERAIELSREKYCSVWHSMRHDIDLTVTYQITAGL